MLNAKSDQAMVAVSILFCMFCGWRTWTGDLAYAFPLLCVSAVLLSLGGLWVEDWRWKRRADRIEGMKTGSDREGTS